MASWSRFESDSKDTATSAVLQQYSVSTPSAKGQATYGTNTQATTYDRACLLTIAKNIISSNWPTGQVLAMILPPGAVLNDDDMLGGHPSTSSPGFPGVHGKFSINNKTVYFCAVVWCSGCNGVVVPGWAPWQSTCAALYKELAQVWTNPDVDDLRPDGNPNGVNGWATWATGINGKKQWLEIGNLAGLWASSQANKYLIYGTVSPQTGNTSYPMRALWSNMVSSPLNPRPSPPLSLPGPYFPTGFKLAVAPPVSASTQITVSNKTSEAVTVYLTLGSTPGCTSCVSDVAFVTETISCLQGSFSLPANTSVSYQPPPGVGFGGNFCFGTPPLNCATNPSYSSLHRVIDGLTCGRGIAVRNSIAHADRICWA